MQNYKALKINNKKLFCKTTFSTRFDKMRYLMNLMESLPRRLQAVMDGVGNHMMY
jgi:hypothetical protein